LPGDHVQENRQADMIAKLIIQTILVYALTGVLLFGAAGTWRWPQAWIFIIEMMTTGIALGVWLARHDPTLLAERMSSPLQRGQERADKIFIICLFAAWPAWLVFMALDAVRFRLSHLPEWAQALGAVLILIAMYAMYLTFRENSFAAAVVKIQAERGQTVVTTGPYGYVRHPMYAGASLLFFGIPLLLGSGYGLALAPVWLALISWRIPMEERMLRDKLDGYEDYMRRVRYRLIPGVW
jgi:protein-S-isoprenylcysteine O-methyltransferase Ste14